MFGSVYLTCDPPVRPVPCVDRCSGVAESDPVWLNDVVMEKFSVVLERVLYQTVECLADDRWELRRMGTQVRMTASSLVVTLRLCYGNVSLFVQPVPWH